MELGLGCWEEKSDVLMVLPPPAAGWMPAYSTQEHGFGERQKMVCSWASSKLRLRWVCRGGANSSFDWCLGFWEPVQAVGDTRWAVTQPQGLVLFVLCWEAAQPTQVLKHWPQNTPIWATWQGPAGCKVWRAEPAGARSPHLQGISPTSNQELPMLSPWWAQGDSQHQAPQLRWWAEQACGRSSWSWLKSRLHVPHLAVLFDLWFLWSGEKPAYK